MGKIFFLRIFKIFPVSVVKEILFFKGGHRSQFLSQGPEIWNIRSSRQWEETVYLFLRFFSVSVVKEVHLFKIAYRSLK